MIEYFGTAGISTPFLIVIIVIGLWDAVWKLIAMWKAGRNNQLAWFIVIAIFNTIGILPIIYLFMVDKRIPARLRLKGTKLKKNKK